MSKKQILQTVINAVAIALIAALTKGHPVYTSVGKLLWDLAFKFLTSRKEVKG